MPHRPVPRHHRAFARQLRAQSTDPERLLWWALRSRQVAGWRFRRQVPMGPFVLDFYCPRAHLAVELDGAHHDPIADSRRDAWLIARGIRVLRVANAEVFDRLDDVLLTILGEVEAPTDPTPNRA